MALFHRLSGQSAAHAWQQISVETRGAAHGVKTREVSRRSLYLAKASKLKTYTYALKY